MSLEKSAQAINVVVYNLGGNLYLTNDFIGGMVYYDLDAQMKMIADPTFGDCYKLILKNNFGIKIQEIDMEHYSRTN